MAYELLIGRKVLKKLKKIPPPQYQQIKQAILQLQHQPKPPGTKALKGQDAYRIRIGQYRVIYQIKHQKLQVLIIQIGHRKDVYR